MLLLKIFLQKFSNSYNRQLLSYCTIFQTSSISFFLFEFKTCFVNSKLQNEMNPSWIQDLYYLLCKNRNSRFFTWHTHLILEVSLHSWLLWPMARHRRHPPRARRRLQRRRHRKWRQHQKMHFTNVRQTDCMKTLMHFLSAS